MQILRPNQTPTRTAANASYLKVSGLPPGAAGTVLFVPNGLTNQYTVRVTWAAALPLPAALPSSASLALASPPFAMAGDAPSALATAAWALR